MSEEFEGNRPKINIVKDCDYIFTYTCAKTGRILYRSCNCLVPLSDKCFDCIGMNTKFTKFFRDNRYCSCGYKVDFGYFLLIFQFEEAGLLPDDFRMMCCKCYDKSKKPSCKECVIDG